MSGESGRSRSATLLRIAIVLVLAVVISSAGYYVFVASRVPAQEVRIDRVTVDPSGEVSLLQNEAKTLQATAYDHDGKALTDASFKWESNPTDLGNLDATTGSRVTFTAGELVGDGEIKVTATRGASSNAVSVATHVKPQPGAPTVTLNVTRDLMTVAVDASRSQPAVGSTIAGYQFDFRDSTPVVNRPDGRASHVYTSEGTYDVKVTVSASNSKNTLGLARVTVAHSTIDYTFKDMFQIPYKDYWYRRQHVYGDIIMRNWNTTGGCPCVDYYPWIKPYRNDSFLYTNVRMQAVGKNLDTYTVDQPVLLPTAAELQARASANYITLDLATGPFPTGGRIGLYWQWQYDTLAAYRWYQDHGYDMPTRLVDGFEGVLNGTLNLDYLASQKIFGVKGDPTAFWAAVVDPDLQTTGPMEDAWDAWFMFQGRGPYEVYNGFEYPYSSQAKMQMQVTVLQNADGTNTTRVEFFYPVWGQDVLLSRWFYWGSTQYLLPGPDGKYGNTEFPPQARYAYDNYLNPAAPKGWWGQELGWFEDFHFNATIDSKFNFNLNTVLGYQMKAWALPGPDGKPKTADDVPLWNFEPAGIDYVPNSTLHPASELNPYYNNDGTAKYNYLHMTPGTEWYGRQFEYDYAPVTWNLRHGQTMSFVFPQDKVVFYDPVNSKPAPDPSYAPDLKEIWKYMRVSDVGGLPHSLYQVKGNVLSIVGQTGIQPAGTARYNGVDYPLVGSLAPSLEMSDTSPLESAPQQTAAALMGVQGYWDPGFVMAVDARRGE